MPDVQGPAQPSDIVAKAPGDGASAAITQPTDQTAVPAPTPPAASVTLAALANSAIPAEEQTTTTTGNASLAEARAPEPSSTSIAHRITTEVNWNGVDSVAQAMVIHAFSNRSLQERDLEAAKHASVSLFDERQSISSGLILATAAKLKINAIVSAMVYEVNPENTMSTEEAAEISALIGVVARYSHNPADKNFTLKHAGREINTLDGATLASAREVALELYAFLTQLKDEGLTIALPVLTELYLAFERDHSNLIEAMSREYERSPRTIFSWINDKLGLSGTPERITGTLPPSPFSPLYSSGSKH